VEATAHLTKGLELLKTLLDTPERTQQELALQTTLGSTLIAIRGWAAPEVERAYTRALELCRQVEEPRQLFPVLWGLWAMYIVQAECRMAHELGEQLLSSAQSLQDPALLLQAHFALGNTSFWRGELAAARSHLEQGIALYDPQQHRSLASLYAVDPGMFCRGYATWVLWHLGFPGQALKLSYETLTFAQDLSHPQSLALALLFASVLHLYRREEQAAQERAEATIALSNEQGFPFYLAWGTIVRGWTLVEQGQRDEGIAQMRQGWVAHQATGAKMAGPHLLALPAEAYGKAGRVEEGLAVLAEALAIGDKTEERYYEAELYRLKGQLTLQKFQVSGFKFQVENSSESGVRSLESEAEECFQQAIAIARKQQAKSLELRATVSLARLWQQQGKHHEARNILSGIYSWFTEGFDTADLKEAKALLDEL
jgi:predicted ATPase